MLSHSHFTWNLWYVYIYFGFVAEKEASSEKETYPKDLESWSKCAHQHRDYAQKEHSHYYWSKVRIWLPSPYSLRDVAQYISTQKATQEKPTLSLIYIRRGIAIKSEFLSYWLTSPRNDFKICWTHLTCNVLRTTIIDICCWNSASEIWRPKEVSHWVDHKWERNPLDGKNESNSFVESRIVSYVQQWII